MKNSILTLAVGAAIGISGTLLTTNHQSTQLPQNNTDNASINDQLSSISTVLQSLNSTTDRLQSLVEKYTYILPEAPSSTLNTAATPKNNTTKGENTPENSNNQLEQFLSQLQSGQSSPAAQQPIDSTPPTPLQLENYNSIETRLSAASNNKTANLSKLLRDAAKLTPFQRATLSQKALQMIKNGEITASQFSSPSGS